MKREKDNISPGKIRACTNDGIEIWQDHILYHKKKNGIWCLDKVIKH